MNRIFITGGTGFFGKSILDYRLRNQAFADSFSFTILSRNPEAFISKNPDLARQPGVEFVRGDVRTFDFRGDFDAIIHAATSAVVNISDEEQTSVIINGTGHVVDFAKASGIEKILFTSSGAVYGPRTSPVSEDDECRPTSAYGKAKLDAEKMLLSSGLDTRIARCFAFTGPYLDRNIHFAIGNFIRDVLNGGKPRMTGDGTPLRSYLFADDLVKWLFGILAKGRNGRTYNVGSPEAISIKDLADLVAAVLGEGIHRPDWRSRDYYATERSVYVPVTTRAESELGMRVDTGLEESISASAI